MQFSCIHTLKHDYAYDFFSFETFVKHLHLKTTFVNGCAHVCVDVCVCYVYIHVHVSVCVYISMRTSIVIRFWNTDLLGACFFEASIRQWLCTRMRECVHVVFICMFFVYLYVSTRVFKELFCLKPRFVRRSFFQAPIRQQLCTSIREWLCVSIKICISF